MNRRPLTGDLASNTGVSIIPTRRMPRPGMAWFLHIPSRTIYIAAALAGDDDARAIAIAEAISQLRAAQARPRLVAVPGC